MIVNSDMNGDELLKLIESEWEMKPPPLLISVTSGANDYRVTSRLKDAFRHGLVKVAKNTGTPLLLRKVNCYCLQRWQK